MKLTPALLRTVSVFLLTAILFSTAACGKTSPSDAGAVESEDEISSGFSDKSEPETVPAVYELSERQKNSVAMLNYLAVLTQEISACRNSRLYLEEAYTSLINNVNPGSIDERTQEYLSGLLDTIEEYRMIAVKRERIQTAFERKKAEMILSAIREPAELLTYISTINPQKIAEIAFAVLSSSGSLLDTADTLLRSAGVLLDGTLDTEYMEEGWDLDDEEAAVLHENRKQAFLYMIEIVRENELPSSLALSENAVDQFISWKHNTNVSQKLRFLESAADTYAGFGSYWLELAKCYNETGDYRKCLDCMERYTELGTGIFRKDHELAEAAPAAIAAAARLWPDDGEAYEAEAARWTQAILDNTDQDDWTLRYFAAQTCADLYARTLNKDYLDKAYAVSLDNVNTLAVVQKQLNSEYLGAVREIPVSDSLPKSEQKKIKEYNKCLSESRKTALPPVYSPLSLNCDLLFALAEERKISSDEQKRIDGILHGDGANLFLDETIDSLYRFDSEVPAVTASLSADPLLNKTVLTVPASVLSDSSTIVATVTDNGTAYTFDDWIVKNVSRLGGSFSKFEVTLSSKQAGKQTWSDDSVVTFAIQNDATSNHVSYILSFRVSSYKNLYLTALVEFEQVE